MISARTHRSRQTRPPDAKGNPGCYNAHTATITATMHSPCSSAGLDMPTPQPTRDKTQTNPTRSPPPAQIPSLATSHSGCITHTHSGLHEPNNAAKSHIVIGCLTRLCPSPNHTSSTAAHMSSCPLSHHQPAPNPTTTHPRYQIRHFSVPKPRDPCSRPKQKPIPDRGNKSTSQPSTFHASDSITSRYRPHRHSA